MHFSCKITNAVLTELESRGEDLSSLYEPGFPAMELMRDPTSWMSAHEMENFFENLFKADSFKLNQTIFVDAGHSGPKHRAWGVLDSVLRMMPRPQDVLQQPEKFLSYFISPEPPIENLFKDQNGVSFDLPLLAEQYPLINSYLKAAFESLPAYKGEGLGRCEWSGIHIQLTWSNNQQHSMFAQDPGHQINPELLQSVIADHQRLLREIEEKNREIQRKDDELQHLKQNQNQAPSPTMFSTKQALENLRLADEGQNSQSMIAPTMGQNLARLHDYMVRAQQLITVLIGNSKKDPAIKEALRRLDWDHVKMQYPRAISECVEQLRKLHAHQSSVQLPVKKLHTLAEPVNESRKESQHHV